MIAFHLIVSAYGFWLPNDPRGSWSDFVGSWELLKFGPATKVNDRRSYAHDPHDVALRRAAKQALKYPPVRFDDAHRVAIAGGFARACEEAGYVCRACCIGFDHAHLVCAEHPREIPVIAGHLKSHATRELTEQGIHPLRIHRQARRPADPMERRLLEGLHRRGRSTPRGDPICDPTPAQGRACGTTVGMRVSLT